MVALRSGDVDGAPEESRTDNAVAGDIVETSMRRVGSLVTVAGSTRPKAAGTWQQVTRASSELPPSGALGMSQMAVAMVHGVAASSTTAGNVIKTSAVTTVATAGMPIPSSFMEWRA